MNISEQLSLLQNIKGNFKTKLLDIGAHLDENTPFSAYPECIQKTEKTVYTDKVNGSTNKRDAYSRIVFDKKLNSNSERDSVNRIIPDKLNASQLILNVSQSGGIITPYGIYQGADYAYLMFEETAPIQEADNWEFRTKYTHQGGQNAGSILGCHTDIDFTVPVLCGNPLTVFLSSNGSSWNIVLAGASSQALETGRTYYIKFGFTGAEYYIEINTQGWDTEFIRIYTIVSDIKAYCVQPFTLTGRNLGGAYYSSYGQMDLKETSIIINGSLWKRLQI